MKGRSDRDDAVALAGADGDVAPATPPLTADDDLFRTEPSRPSGGRGRGRARRIVLRLALAMVWVASPPEQRRARSGPVRHVGPDFGSLLAGGNGGWKLPVRRRRQEAGMLALSDLEASRSS
jgi:hypothetical protein